MTDVWMLEYIERGEQHIADAGETLGEALAYGAFLMLSHGTRLERLWGPDGEPVLSGAALNLAALDTV